MVWSMHKYAIGAVSGFINLSAVVDFAVCPIYNQICAYDSFMHVAPGLMDTIVPL